MDWLQKITTALADSTRTERSLLALDEEARASILDVARTASHTSGDRRNAPLLCYVLGVLAGRGIALDQTIGVVANNAAEGGVAEGGVVEGSVVEGSVVEGSA